MLMNRSNVFCDIFAIVLNIDFLIKLWYKKGYLHIVL